MKNWTEDRLFPAESKQRDLARELFNNCKSLPIISPHGHTDPTWFAEDINFENPTELILRPDHYLFRMLYSQGHSLELLGIPKRSPDSLTDRESWRLFARNIHLFRGTPSSYWLKHCFYEIFQMNRELSEDTADFYFDKISEKLQSAEFSAQNLFKTFNIETLSTTDAATDSLESHQKIADSSWSGRVIPCFRPDQVTDPEHESFRESLLRLSELTNKDCNNPKTYLEAIRLRRDFFKKHGATSTDHGYPSAYTHQLSEAEFSKLHASALSGTLSAKESEVYRGHILIELAKMSIDDGLVMQLHVGSYRNHNKDIFDRYGRDVGADIPMRAEFTNNLKPLLDCVGNSTDLSIILFSLDESTYSRELAPLAGHYPCLKLGPSWWFHDSPEGMRRFKERVIETAGFYNLVGFNDDTRAFLSIPARHEMARRMDASFLSQLVVDGRIGLNEAYELSKELAYGLAKKAYKL